MAQYYYDLKIVDKNGIPVMPKGQRSQGWGSANAKYGKVAGNFAQLGFTTGATDSELGLAAGLNVANVEVLLKTSVSFYNYGGNYSNSAGAAIFLRAQNQLWAGSGSRALNGYYFCLNGSSNFADHARNASVYSYENGNFGSFEFRVTGALASHTNNTFREFYFMRVKCQGTALTMKVWKEGDPEPASPQLSTASSIFTGPGDVFLNFGRGAAYSVPFFSIGTDGDPAPLSPTLRTVSGVVTDSAGLPAIRTVRIYARDSGAILGDVQSNAAGVYELQTAYSDEVNVVFIDDAGGEVFNDLILRTTPV